MSRAAARRNRIAAMTPATTTMNAPVGPPIWTLLPPSSEIRKPPMIAVTSPALRRRSGRDGDGDAERKRDERDRNARERIAGEQPPGIVAHGREELGLHIAAPRVSGGPQLFRRCCLPISPRPTDLSIGSSAKSCRVLKNRHATKFGSSGDPYGDSNPCFRRERATSWTARRRGRCAWRGGHMWARAR